MDSILVGILVCAISVELIQTSCTSRTRMDKSILADDTSA